MSRGGSSDGFTLVELVLVIAILGSIAAVGAPRFFGTSEFDERVFLDKTIAALRYSQKLAVATGCDVQVTLSGTAYTLNQQPLCSGALYTKAVIHPATGDTGYTGTAPSGVTITSSPSVFRFDGLGRAIDTSGAVTDASIGIGSRSIAVDGETGLARVLP